MSVFLKCIKNIEPMSGKLEILNIGQWYIMEEISIGQSRSSVKVDGKWYNSILFEYYNDFMKEFDVYHSEYSPYWLGKGDK